MALDLTSPVFSPGGDIPRDHTCDGADVSPPLSWTDPPEGTQSQALICEDPDAPAGTWVHWVLYHLPPDLRNLPKGIDTSPTPTQGWRQGKNDFGRPGYGGPCPPPGPAHRYFFRIYALDAPLDLGPGATKPQLLEAMDDHILTQSELLGRYAR